LGVMIWELFKSFNVDDICEVSVRDIIDPEKAEDLFPVCDGDYIPGITSSASSSIQSAGASSGAQSAGATKLSVQAKSLKAVFELATECHAYNPEKRSKLDDAMTTIRDNGVRYTIDNNPSAEDFWKGLCWNKYNNRVLLSAIADGVVRGLDLKDKDVAKELNLKDEDVAKVLNIKDKDLVKKLNLKVTPEYCVVDTIKKALPPSWRLMNITHFWCLCNWFPNFFSKGVCFRRMLRIVNSPWYCSNEKQALDRVRSSKDNAFVIRPSLTSADYSPFTLCVKIAGHVWNYHIICHSTSQPVISKHFTCCFLRDKEYKSVITIAKDLKRGGIRVASSNIDINPTLIYGQQQ